MPRLLPAHRLLVHPLLLYFLLAFVLSAALRLPAVLTGGRINSGINVYVLLDLLSTAAPAVAALLVVHRSGGAADVRLLLRRAFDPRVPGWAYALALCFTGIVLLGSSLLASLAHGAPGGLRLQAPAAGFMLSVLAQLFVMVGEELGWRGLAWPRLQARLGSVPAVLLLGTLHAAWHWPLFFTLGASQYHASFPRYLLLVLSWTVVWGVLHHAGRGRLGAVMLFHAALNLWGFFMLLPRGAAGWTAPLTLLLAATLLSLLPRPYFGRSEPSPAAVQGSGAEREDDDGRSAVTGLRA